MSHSTIENELIEARVEEIRTTRKHGIEASFDAGDLGGSIVNGVGKLISNEGDKVTIVSTQDGEPREINTNMLAKTLKKRLPDGRRAFEMVDPQTGKVTGYVPEYVTGTIPCWFNQNSPRFDELSAIPGLRGFTCDSAHLASEFDAEQHAKNRHTRRYRMALDYLERKEREDDRAIRREEVAAMRALVSAGRTPAVADEVIYRCEGCTRFFDSDQGLKIHRSKEQH